jgi:hypothetical protein
MHGADNSGVRLAFVKEPLNLLAIHAGRGYLKGAGIFLGQLPSGFRLGGSQAHTMQRLVEPCCA